MVFVANDKTTDFNLNWDNLLKPNNAGIVSGKAVFDNTRATILLDRMKYVVEDSTWQIVKANPIVIDSSFAISVEPITFYNQNQLITLGGKWSKKLISLVNNVFPKTPKIVVLPVTEPSIVNFASFKNGFNCESLKF